MDCSRVYVIPQAGVLGVHLSEVAPLYFLVLLTIAVLGMVYASWELLVVYMALFIAGLSVIPYLVYLELVVAEALCLVLYYNACGHSRVHSSLHNPLGTLTQGCRLECFKLHLYPA